MSGDDDTAEQEVLRLFAQGEMWGECKVSDLDEIRERIVKLSMREHLSTTELEEFDSKVQFLSTHMVKVRREIRATEPAAAKTSEIEVPPSSYLYRLGLLLDKSTREMVFTPLIADFEHEYFEAVANGQPTRLLIWVYRCHATIALFRALWLGLRKQLVSGGS